MSGRQMSAEMGPGDMRVPATGGGGRLPFVDLARGAAVLFMVQGHTLAALMAPEYNGNAFAQGWLFLRGLTSCTFLMLSGFSFSLATSRRWTEFRTPGRRVLRRLARYAMLVTIGYSMRFPARSFAQLATVTPEQWQTFAVVDVLQLVGLSLLLLQAGVWLLRSRRAFMIAAFLGAAGVVAATPLVSRVAQASSLPIFLAAYLSTAKGSLFPAMPWAAYILFGAGLGIWYAGRDGGRVRGDAAWPFLAGGAAMVALGTLVYAVPWSPYGAVDFWTVSPGLFLLKAGSVLALLGAAIRLMRRVKSLPTVVTALSRESLLVYLVHVVLLYGSAWTVGLGQSVGARLSPGPAIGFIAVLLTAMTLMAWTWYECKRHLGSVASAVRVGAVSLVLYAMIFQV